MGDVEGPTAHIDCYEQENEGNHRYSHAVSVPAWDVEASDHRHVVGDDQDHYFVGYFHAVLSPRFERADLVDVDTGGLGNEDEEDRLDPRLVVDVHCDQHEDHPAKHVDEVEAEGGGAVCSKPEEEVREVVEELA